MTQATSDPDPYEIVPVSQCDADEIVGALAIAFDRDDFTESWYRWKHVECPFGPSEGWVARDDDGIVGVRLFTPWPWSTPVGPIDGLRAMDGGVIPRARRRGVFATLVRTEMDAREKSGEAVVALSTSVPASRAAYVKLGWCALGVLDHVVRPVLPRLARLESWDPTPASKGAAGSEHIGTAWTSEALRWRFDERAGHDYRSVRLAKADDPNGLSYRVISQRGLRMLVVEHAVGDQATVARLAQAVAADTRSALLLTTGGPGGSQHTVAGRFVRPRGASTLTSWAVGVPDGLYVDRLESWALSLGDVEGVL